MDTVSATVPSPRAGTPADVTTPPAARAAADGGFKPFGDDGLTFFDLLDVVNPFQHIPVVATLYREWTGDQIDPVPRMAGGGLFGGVIGLVASLANVVVEDATGQDMGEHVLALVTDDGAGPAEVAAAAKARPWVNPDTAPWPPGPSPVAQHLEVLEWARAEVAAVTSPPPAPGAGVLAWARGEAAFAAEAAAAARYRDAVLLAEARGPALDLRE